MHTACLLIRIKSLFFVSFRSTKPLAPARALVWCIWCASSNLQPLWSNLFEGLILLVAWSVGDHYSIPEKSPKFQETRRGLLYLPVTSRPLIFSQKEAFLSPFTFATTRLTACILNFIQNALKERRRRCARKWSSIKVFLESPFCSLSPSGCC